MVDSTLDFMCQFLRTYIHEMHSKLIAIFEIISKADCIHNNLRLGELRTSSTLRSWIKSKEA